MVMGFVGTFQLWQWRKQDTKSVLKYLLFNFWMIRFTVIWIWSWYFHWLQNSNTLMHDPCNKFGILTLKSWHFEVSGDIMTKFKSQCFHIKIMKYWNASGSGSPPSLISAHWNSGILQYKQAKLRKYMQHSVAKMQSNLGLRGTFENGSVIVFNS